jgi:hypothetical protein
MYSFNIFRFRSSQTFEADKWKKEKKQIGETQGSETRSARSEDPMAPDFDVEWVISEPENT